MIGLRLLILKRNLIVRCLLLVVNKLSTINTQRAIKLLVLILGFAIKLNAQQPVPPTGDERNTPNATPTENLDTLLTKEQELDTAAISYFSLNNRLKVESEHDSLLNNHFEQHDPVFRQEYDYAHLGFPATPAHPLWISPNATTGLDLGFHAFDIYAVSHNTLKFYNQTKTFSDVFYSGSTQNNSLFEAKIARNFANNLHLTVDYRRVSTLFITENDLPSVRNTLYSVPRGRTTTLGIGLWYQGARYESFLTYTSHLVSELDRGGITTSTTFDTTNTSNSTALLAKVNPNAQSRYERYDYTFQHFFRLGKVDTVPNAPEHRQYKVAHTVQLSTTKNFNFDFATDTTDLVNKQNFYGKLFSDTRGLQLNLNTLRFANTVWISTEKKPKLRNVQTPTFSDSLHFLPKLSAADSLKRSFKAFLSDTIPPKILSHSDSVALLTKLKSDSTRALLPLDTTTSKSADNLEIGLMHEFWSIKDGSSLQHPQNLIGLARFRFAPTPNINAQATGQINFLGNNVGDYAFGADFTTVVPKIGSLIISAKNQLFSPTFLQNQLLITDSLIWQNNFSKTLQTSFSGKLVIDIIDVALQGSYTLTNNAIYFDQTYTPQQSGAPVSLLQLSAKKEIAVGIFHFETQLLFQKSSQFFVPVPSFYTKSSFFAEGRIFKRGMLVRGGFDLRYASAWFAPGYIPIINQFYVQQTREIAPAPVVDVFFSAQVKRLRVFIKLENVAGAFTNRVNYETYLYPTPDFSTGGAIYTPLRFGLRWQFLN